ncbi:hypothetical protein ACIBF1_32030 [Spirillospora sp. NPDC050679]
MTARTTLRGGLFGGALLGALLAVPPFGAPAAAADCAVLRGAAASAFDRRALCRHLRSEIATDGPDLVRALRESLRGSPAAREPLPGSVPKSARRSAQRTARQAAREASRKAVRAPKGDRADLGAQKPRTETEAEPEARHGTRHEPHGPAGRAGDPVPGGAPLGGRPAAPSPFMRSAPRPDPPATVRVTVPAAPTANRAPAENGMPPSTLAAMAVICLLLGALVLHKRRPLPGPAAFGTLWWPAARRLRPAPSRLALLSARAEAVGDAEGIADAGAVATATALATPSGLGVVGPGANAFMRAVLVELLTGEAGHVKVVVSRGELLRMFEDGLDETLLQALAPRLHVCELLEDAIEHLELEMLMADAERANPDLSPTGGRDLPTAYWIATPGQDDDVVLPLVRRGGAHRLVGLMFGVWPHGRTVALEADGRLSRGPAAASLTAEEALARLRAGATAEHGDWF